MTDLAPARTLSRRERLGARARGLSPSADFVSSVVSARSSRRASGECSFFSYEILFLVRLALRVVIAVYGSPSSSGDMYM